MTDSINNFIEEASIHELEKALSEAEHQDEKDFLRAEIERREALEAYFLSQE